MAIFATYKRQQTMLERQKKTLIFYLKNAIQSYY